MAPPIVITLDIIKHLVRWDPQKGGAYMVPKRLKEARMEAGLAQAKLSQLLSVEEGVNTRSRFSSYEVGRTEPPFSLVKKLLNYSTIQRIIFTPRIMILLKRSCNFTESAPIQSQIRITIR